jgi:hypothetical protein
MVALALAEPTVPDGFALRPTFKTSQGTVTSGTAFAVKIGDDVVIITAYHLFGPAGGLAEWIPADAVGAGVTGATLQDIYSGKKVGVAGAAHVVEGARMMDENGADADLAVLRVGERSMRDRMEQGGLTPGELAAAGPKKGDAVYVATKPVSGEAPRAIPATVVEVSDTFVFYEFTNGGLDLTATSGAPLLDDAGKVVGLHIGGGQIEGKLIGSGAPIPAVRARIDKAMSGN